MSTSSCWTTGCPLTVAATWIGYVLAAVPSGGFAVTVMLLVLPAVTVAVAAWLWPATSALIVQPSGPFVWTVYVASAGLSLWSVRLKLNEAPVVAAPLRRGMSVVSENSPAPVDSATRMSIGRSAA